MVVVLYVVEVLVVGLLLMWNINKTERLQAEEEDGGGVMVVVYVAKVIVVGLLLVRSTSMME